MTIRNTFDHAIFDISDVAVLLEVKFLGENRANWHAPQYTHSLQVIGYSQLIREQSMPGHADEDAKHTLYY